MSFTYAHQNPSGGMITTHSAVTAASTVKLDCRGYNALLLLHTRTSGTAYATCILRTDENTNFKVHPATTTDGPWGLNVKTSGQAANTVTFFKGITPFIGVALNYTAGTHTVRAMPINV